MKKLKNKFIIIVISVIALIVCLQVFSAYSNANRDTNSYLTLVKWNATLNETRLDVDMKNILSSWDKIRVIGNSSLAVIEWGDGSMTRLWGNTKISIEQNQISRDFTNINISFDLIAGKTWSNVVSFIWQDSSFTQTFDGVEAGVRGTVFDVDLEKDFIHVSDHVVELTAQDGSTMTISEWNVLNLDTFSFIELSKYVSELKDAAWTELNDNFDAQQIWRLKSDLEDSLQSSNPFLFLLRWISPKHALFYILDTYEDQSKVDSYISWLSEDSKTDLYDYVLWKYQQMNFVSPSDSNYNKKMRYKSALVSLWVSTTDSQRLVASSWYDLQDIVESENAAWLEQTVRFLWNNIDKLSESDVSILKGWLDYIPEGLLEEFSGSFDQLGDILDIDFSQISEINSDSIWNALDGAEEKIQDLLEENFGGTLQKLTQ